MRLPFLTAPQHWTQAQRASVSRTDYACGVQVFRTAPSRRDYAMRAVAIVLALVALALWVRG